MKRTLLTTIAVALTVANQAATAPPSADGAQTAEINGAHIYYEVAGSGPPLLLIHGYPLSSQLFREQAEGLSDRYRVITPDLRGFGESEAPDSEASIETYAEDMLALMDHLEIEQAVIGGHSMGGMTTLEMYRQAPERFLGMLLINTTAAAPTIVGQSLWRGFAEQAEAEGVKSLVPELLDEMLSGTSRANDKELVETMTEVIEQASVEGAVGGGNALADREDYSDLLARIEVPVLILVGREDTVTPVMLAEKLEQGIPNSHLVVIDDASHVSVIEKPDEANEAIRSWSSQRLSASR